MKRYFIPVLVLAFSLAAAGCAKKGIEPISDGDNPAHHYLVGMKLLDKKDLKQAETHFDRALKLDPNYANAMAGMALTAAMKVDAYSDSDSDEGHRSVELQKALEFLDNAEGKADGDSQEFSVAVTGIRVYTYGKPKKWIKYARGHYKDAKGLNDVNRGELIYYRSEEAADYFMGVAAYKALAFRESEDLLAKVMEAPSGRWHQPARTLFKKVHKIVRAIANYTLTDVAKKIAIKEKVVRADVAALLVDDLHLDRLMAGRIPVPGKEPETKFVPADIMDSPFKSEIMTALKWNLRGLEPEFDQTSQAYLFHPQGPIKRKELAFILEDLLSKISGDESIATAFFGHKRSPYPDVSPSSPWFNAVMNAVSRNLMESGLSGAFRPEDTADGAELLLAVLRLRDVMNIY